MKQSSLSLLLCGVLVSGPFGCSADEGSPAGPASAAGGNANATLGNATVGNATVTATSNASSTAGLMAPTGTQATTTSAVATVSGVGTNVSGTASGTATGVTGSTVSGVASTSIGGTSTSAGGAASTSSTGVPSTGGMTSTNSVGGGGGTGGTGNEVELENFSFFVTSLAAMRQLSNNQDGFGGDLTYGEQDGLSGADKICTEIAESSMPGASAKQWRAFLSVQNGPEGGPVNAIDRIGNGPWYDRVGRVVAMDLDGLLNERPDADPAIAEDLPNELGEPNHFAGGQEMDNHDVLTGSNEDGELDGDTCDDWTSIDGNGPEAGHSWPAQSGQHWISSHAVAGCAPSVVEGQGSFFGDGVGDGGGYGAIYCFALAP